MWIGAFTAYLGADTIGDSLSVANADPVFDILPGPRASLEAGITLKAAE